MALGEGRQATVSAEVDGEAEPQAAQSAVSYSARMVEALTKAMEDAQAAGEPVDALAGDHGGAGEHRGRRAAQCDAPARKLTGKGKGRRGAATTGSTDD